MLSLVANNTPRAVPPREKTVAVYGGASIPEGSKLYGYCEKVGKALAEAGLGVLTGGGPGAMKAVAQSAQKHGGYTIGAAMPFIGETPYPGNHEYYEFDTFSDRIDIGYETKAALTAAVPGGMGTYQEITKKAVELYLDKTLYPSQKQIVLFEYQDFWKKFIQHLKDGPVAYGMMNPRFLDLFKVVDDINAGVALLLKSKDDVPWTPGVKPKVPATVKRAGNRLELVA